MFKKVLIAILVGTIIFIVFICIKYNEQIVQIVKHIPSSGTYVRYIEVKERIPYNVVDAELVDYDEDMILEKSDLIFKGKVIGEKEIGLEEYIDGRLRHTYYRDVFTFKVEEIYYSVDSSVKKGDVIRVANGSCSNFWIEGTIKMEKGKEYIVLTKKSHDSKTVEFSKYYDFAVVTHWVSIISIEDSNYLFDEVFTSLKSSAKEEKIREDGGFETKMYKKGKEFEEELENLISKKKGEN